MPNNYAKFNNSNSDADLKPHAATTSIDTTNTTTNNNNITNNKTDSDNYYYGPCRSNDTPLAPPLLMGHSNPPQLLLLSKGIKPEPNYLLLGEVEKELRAVKEKSKFEKRQQSGSQEFTQQQQQEPQNDKQQQQQQQMQQLNVSSLLNEMKMSKKWQNLSQNNVSNDSNYNIINNSTDNNGTDFYLSPQNPDNLKPSDLDRLPKLPKKRPAPPVPVTDTTQPINPTPLQGINDSTLYGNPPSNPFLLNNRNNIVTKPNNNSSNVTANSVSELSSAGLTPSVNSLFDDNHFNIQDSSLNLLASLDEYLNAAEVGKLNLDNNNKLDGNIISSTTSCVTINNNINNPWNEHSSNKNAVDLHSHFKSSNVNHRRNQDLIKNTSTPIASTATNSSNNSSNNNSSNQVRRQKNEDVDLDLLNFKSEIDLSGNSRDESDGLMGNFVLRSKNEPKISLDSGVPDSSTINGTVKIKPSDIKKHRIWLNLNPGLKVSQQLPQLFDNNDDSNNNHTNNTNPSNLGCYDELNDSGFHNNYNDNINNNDNKNREPDNNATFWSGYPATGIATRITSDYLGNTPTQIGNKQKNRDGWNFKNESDRGDKFLRETRYHCGRKVDVAIWWLAVAVLIFVSVGFICGFLAGWFAHN